MLHAEPVEDVLVDVISVFLARYALYHIRAESCSPVGVGRYLAGTVDLCGLGSLQSLCEWHYLVMVGSGYRVGRLAPAARVIHYVHHRYGLIVAEVP